MLSSDRLLDSELADDIEFLAARARSIGTAHANEFLKALGLRVRSYAVLSLACSGHNPAQRELAEFLSLDASQIVALVDDLEARGLVARLADARDRRSNCIVGTETGRELYEDAKSAALAGQNRALRALDPNQRTQLRALLRAVAFDESADATDVHLSAPAHSKPLA